MYSKAFYYQETRQFYNHAVPEQESEGWLESFPYGYGVRFDEKGQLRELCCYGYPSGKLTHIQNYPEIVRHPSLEWKICFDEKGNMIVDECVRKASNSDLQEVCYGQNEFTRVLEKEGKLENLRQTVFNMINDLDEKEQKRIEKIKKGCAPLRYKVPRDYGYNGNFDDKYAETTDLAFLLGGDRAERIGDSYQFWRDGYGEYGYMDGNCASQHNHCLRPALDKSEVSLIEPDTLQKGKDGETIATYGEYPQTLADEKTSAELEELFNIKSKNLKPTGKIYTFDSQTNDFEPFIEEKNPEYEYKSKKFIRVLARPAISPDSDWSSRLSNGKAPQKGQYYWVKVEPIEWIVTSNIWKAKKNLLAGIYFDVKSRYDGDFDSTFMKKYLDTYFAKEVLPSKIRSREKEKQLLQATKGTKVKKKTGLKATLAKRQTAEDRKKAEAIKAVKDLLKE